MENAIELKKRLLGKLANDTPMIVTDIDLIITQEESIWVFLSSKDGSLDISFDIENEIQASKYYTLISFFNSETHKEKDHYLEVYGPHLGNQTADKFLFIYVYK